MSPWGPIIAAAIAGFIAFVGMVITKDGKVSEFRQAWIIELRHLLSSLISISDVLRINAGFPADKQLDARKEANKIIAEISLHLNNSNLSDSEKKLHEAMGLLRNNVLSGTTDLTEFYKGVTDAGHIVLKEEWERVKRGEKNYIFIKDVLFVVGFFSMALLMLTMIVYAISHSGILLLPK
ncbi:hypothetical protein OLZ33_08700 [Pantoea ananatis]|uniref:hypothetical protein n=1 Tax=Pantoea ananas TaxID=553 RepID=UPI0015884D86|nr:hypothetical protein [Pantoea ananatis]MBA4819449.1 hypothetical protein [Pantoea ananatis]MCW1832080.1 hypothetical protein [Pantoea ananatis]QKV86313.1 hypothetical protein FOB88_03790 [Pantoea ananatis]